MCRVVRVIVNPNPNRAARRGAATFLLLLGQHETSYTTPPACRPFCCSPARLSSRLLLQVTPMLFLCRASPLLQRTALLSPLRFFAPSKSSFNRTFANTAVRFSIEMETVDTSERLAQLRELMKRNNLDVYSESISLPCRSPEKLLTRRFNLVVPSEDSHQSEYIAHCDARRGTYNSNDVWTYSLLATFFI